MEPKKLIVGKRQRIDLYSLFDGFTLEEVIDNIVAECYKVGGEKHDFEVSPFGGEYIVHCISYRYETDKEYERRLNGEKKAKEKKKLLKIKQEESERKEFERLKKKYG